MVPNTFYCDLLLLVTIHNTIVWLIFLKSIKNKRSCLHSTNT